MRFVGVRAALRQVSILASAATVGFFGLWCLSPSATESAIANGDTRTLHLYHTHTGESIDATFRVNGRYDGTVLRQLNHFLRDWRNNDETNMDPRLFDTIWEVYRTAGATDPIQIYSAYRSPETNAMLRRRSRAVAEHSQHMLGKAMDTTMPGFPMHRIREIGMKLQRGGVGWYPSSNFVHLDVGGVRSWPRMSYDQLASLFPDGRTVHIASNGQTLPGYEQARLELASHGGVDLPPAQESQGFFAWLFGGGSSGAAREDEEDRRATMVASASPQSQQQVAPLPAPVAQPSPPQQPALAYAQPALAPLSTAPAADAKAAVQLASLEPGAAAPNTGEPLDLGAVMPLPPRRPSDLADAQDVPLPPVRPDSLTTIKTASIRFTDAQTGSLPGDKIGGMVTATASGVPMVRKSRLPAIITQGGGSPRGQALAFAAIEDAPSRNFVVPEPVARPSELRSAGLRSVARKERRFVVPAQASAVPPMPVGPRLTGLRSAARSPHLAAAL